MGRPKAQVYALLALDRILRELTDAEHPLTVSRAKELLHAIYRIDVSDEFVRTTLFGALKEFYALGELPGAAAFRAKGSLLFPPRDALYVQESRGRGSKNRIALVRREVVDGLEEDWATAMEGAALTAGVQGAEPELIHLRCSAAMLPHVVKRFGARSGFSVQRDLATGEADDGGEPDDGGKPDAGGEPDDGGKPDAGGGSNGAGGPQDGWYDVRFQAPVRGLARWALGYPESVEVIGPLEAREQVRALLSQGVRRYGMS